MKGFMQAPPYKYPVFIATAQAAVAKHLKI
jgi:hypothetical protein